jgi:hypothetical protein
MVRWAINAGKLFWFPVVALVALVAMNNYETPLPRGFTAAGHLGRWLLIASCISYGVFIAGFVAVGRRLKAVPLMIAAALVVGSLGVFPWTRVPLYVASGLMGVAMVMAHRQLDIKAGIAGWLGIIAGMFGVAFDWGIPALLFIPLCILELRVLQSYVDRNTRRFKVRRRKDVELLDKAA